MEALPVPVAAEIWAAQRKRFLGVIAAIHAEAEKWRAEKEVGGQLSPGLHRHYQIRMERLGEMVAFDNAAGEFVEALFETIDRQRDQIRSLRSSIEEGMVADLRAEMRAARQRDLLASADNYAKEKFRRQSLAIAIHAQPELF